MLGRNQATYLTALTEIESNQEASQFEVDDILDYTGATLLDIGVSTVNSLTNVVTFGQAGTEWDTEDILDWINRDAADFYRNNKDLVQLSSFVGGLFIPGMAAARAMKAAKTGKYFIGSLGEQRIQKSVSTVKELIRKEQEFSTAYNSALRSARLTTVGQGVIEGMVYEASFLAAMNKHAYLDQDYDLTDFALGAGLGALVGPLRLMQFSKEFRNLQATTRADKLKGMVLPSVVRGASNGETLSYAGHTINNIAGNTQHADLAKGTLWQSYIDQKAVINSMSDEVLRTRNKTIRPKVDAVQLNLTSGDTLFDTPDEIIGTINKTNPNAFVDVKTFKDFDATKPPTSLLDNIVEQTEEGYSAASGLVARDVLLAPQSKRVPKELSTILDTTPDIVYIIDGIDKITINLAEALNKDQRGWLVDFLSLHPNKAVEITGDTTGLKISPKRLEQEAAFRQAELLEVSSNKFISYNDFLDKIPDTHIATNGIIDPYFGYRILSEGEGITTAGAAYAKDWIKPQANLYKEIPVKRFEDSVAIMDSAWLQAQHMVNNTQIGSAIKLSPGDDFVYKLQAIINNVAETGKPFPSITVGDQVINSIDEAKSILWKEKQGIVTAGKEAGASLAQIAKAANLPLETTELVDLARGKLLELDEHIDIIRYTKNTPEEYIANRPIIANGKGITAGQIEEIKATAILDADMLNQLHWETVENIFQAAGDAGTPTMDALINVFQHPATKYIEDNIGQVLNRLENRWHLTASADFVLRELGELGDHIVTKGTDFIHYTNLHAKKLKEAIEPAARAVKQDLASHTQFSMVRQALDSIPTEKAAQLAYDPKTKQIITSIDPNSGEATYLTFIDSDEVITLTPQMDTFMQSWLPAQQELWGVHNLTRKLAGLPEQQGRAIWFPYHQLNEELIAYKVANKGHDVEIISAKTPKEFQELVVEARSRYAGTHQIVEKDNKLWTQINRYEALEDFKVADIAKQKAGYYATDIVPGTADIDNILPAIQNQIWTKYRKIFQSTNPRIFDALDFLATRDITQAGGEGKTFLQRSQRKVKTAEYISNVLLNKSLVNTDPILDSANNITTAIINSTVAKFQDIWKPISTRFQSLRTGNWDLDSEFVKYHKALTEAGIPIPKSFETFQSFELAAAKAQNKDIALETVHKAQSLMVMLNLRLAETAHAAITTLSFPVLMAGEVTHNGGRPLKTMIDAVKRWNSNTAEALAIKQYAKERGYLRGVVAETTEMLQFLHEDPKIIQKHKKLIGILSSPSDGAENLVREYAFATGYEIAKNNFPNESMEMLASHALMFTKRTMGNYTSRQRPTMFQGTFGAMIGLYQTFMLTMGQNILRYTEAADYKAATKLAAAQTTMFGIESLPAFQLVNQMLGGYISDDHEDIRSTMYKSFGNADDTGLAEYVLFGLPSAALGTGLYTRATLDPRSPIGYDPLNGLSFKPPVMDAVAQTAKFGAGAVQGVVQAAGEGGSITDVFKSFGQAISLQHMWRPGARYAELFMGQSFDQKGEVISTTDEIKDGWAPFARVIGARPLKEQVLRTINYQASYYNSVDKDRKAKIQKQVRRIMTEPYSKEQLEALYIDYIDAGGKFQGWRELINESYMAVDQPYADRLLDDINNQPAISNMLRTYSGG